MLFNSHVFIFIFLPICLIGWYAINRFKFYKTATFFLIGMSLWFYGYFNPKYLYIIFGSMLCNYCFSFLMDKFSSKRKIFFFLGLTGNILLLGYYKYYDFFIENINSLFKTSFALKHILLPLGISFFTLQQISFLIDRYWESAPHYKLLDYLAYVAFFPQLIAGPIVLHNELIPQIQDVEKRRFNFESFRDGITLFVLGLVKKVLIADLFALMVNFGFEKINYLDTMSAWAVALCYTIELYFDFSGYCDMAWGLGKMFNFELPINFNSPYKAHSITEYWQRWHFTLTRFFTTYIYTPVTIVGMRRGKKGLYRYLAPLIVFFISGVWHGASWTFIIWGIAHGLATIWSQRRVFKLGKRKLSWFITFFFVVVTQIIFRCETIPNMTQILKAMFTLSYNRFIIDIASALSSISVIKLLLENIMHIPYAYLYWAYTVVLVILTVITALILRGKNTQEILAVQKKKEFPLPFVFFMGVLLTLCLISMTGVSTFLYFNF